MRLWSPRIHCPLVIKTFLRHKYPDAGQGAVCDLRVRSARPDAFFGRSSSSTSSSAPQSVVPPIIDIKTDTYATGNPKCRRATRNANDTESHAFWKSIATISCSGTMYRPRDENHLEERLLDQAQARASYTPLFWGHSRSIPQGMILDVQPLVKSLFCPIRASPNGFFDFEASTP